jgi:hypothetical protein
MVFKEMHMLTAVYEGSPAERRTALTPPATAMLPETAE